MKWVTVLCIFFTTAIHAQRRADSCAVAHALTELTAICRAADLNDPRSISEGMFYKAAPYIVYRGEDNKRKWKTAANYKLDEDKKGVNDICTRINESINRDSAFRITNYFTEKESEGIWHVLTVSYMKRNKPSEAKMAFLKIGNRYCLGDID